jgi:hypothetical protein
MVSTLVGCSRAYKYYNKVDLIRNGQHSSLLRHDNNYDRKKFRAQAQE